ncbi:midasin-like isoform X3 [Clavelina lepadiformis]|uniref:midasin-like isoform X3 n=1 Tax=Clavelina lepadiformis TaxID=159417 RepID=UPI0040420593
MEHFIVDIKAPLELICKQNNSLKKELVKYLAKQIWNPQDRQHLLSSLATLLVNSDNKSCVEIAKAFGPLTIDLLHRYCSKLKSLVFDDEEAIATHERICIVIGWLCYTSIPSLSDFTLSYLEKRGAPFIRISHNKCESNGAKKRKKMVSNQFSCVLEATYSLIMRYPSILKFPWEWSSLVDCLQHDNIQITSRGRWFLKKILANIVGLCDVDCVELSKEEEETLMLTCQMPNISDSVVDSVQCIVSVSEKKLSHTQQAIVSADLSSSLVAVCGVLLDQCSQSMQENFSDTNESNTLVITKTLQPHLQSLAMAIAERKAVVLQGPVGCGKTALVEYIAQVTGHNSPPHLTKVQLSDETDSKTLTGAYVSTPVPGKFVWQPGILVQACVKGHWLLLEDIDRAPSDVISLLLPLIESGKLSIPGRPNEGDLISTDFRLFMSQRLDNTMSARHLNVSMITKHARVIKLSTIPETDLKEIILAKYSNLSKVVEKILLIYTKLKEEVTVSSHSTQRHMLTRDLFKWCHRLSRSYVAQGSSDLPHNAAMAAIDCFIASCPYPEVRLKMVEQVCSELNISKEKAEYYCHTYKPEIVVTSNVFKVGRSSISRIQSNSSRLRRRRQPFAQTRHSSVLLERISCCIDNVEPVLLVGETGVGKTSCLQYLAQETGNQLHVINMSQQSSSGDLLGGYKPAQMRHYVAPVREDFEKLFPQTFSQKQNQKFLSHVQNCFFKKRYNDLWQLMMQSAKAALKRLKEKKEVECLVSSWNKFSKDLHDLKVKLKSDSPIAFSFVEGKLSQSIQSGDWLLLDEINLATPDTLECLSGVLESDSGSLVLMEKGDAKPIKRQKNFRLFAAMNPATDVGKRNLSEGVRNRFTEIFVDEPIDYSDIATIVTYYLEQRMVGTTSVVDGIVRFYEEIRKMAREKLVDGTGRKPCYSLRTLCRSLSYVLDNSKIPFQRALYEGFSLSFLTALDRSSHPIVIKLIIKHIIGKSKLNMLSQPLPNPDYNFVTVEGHHIQRGPHAPSCDPNYIVTDSVKENLRDLARPVSYGKYPILIQGETSTGKTSLIKFLAALTGNKVIRINNHEHTDLQEYVGSYSSDENGKLVFQDGPLVTAMREGHWVILDELNLAPTDILEALNRVLDDNRELYIPETQDVIHAHARFTLFATQNPPGLYGGRKVLSRAFRNRFVELHFDEIPCNELKTILQKRCQLSPNHSAKLVKIMLELQARRRASGMFAGKHGFITLRDLFRWAERHRRHQVDSSEFYDWEQHLADDGFLLLASRVRQVEEEKVIEEVLQKHLNRSIDRDRLFSLENILKLIGKLPEEFKHIVWTQPMRRLFVTLERALRFDEPVLLVGETGGGKTTVCQLISWLMRKKLSIINCHANTEAADFIGGLRPARTHREHDSSNNTENTSVKLFEWMDGPLVQSMYEGNHILVDEISLADDSVLERLNSVLEPERSLVIPDKLSMSLGTTEGGAFVTARQGFQFLATMNPGGDYGKKELSPALRNRMTEIWCEVVSKKEDLVAILEHNLHLCQADSKDDLILNSNLYANLIVNFVTWFKKTIFGKRFIISIRDLLTWAKFMSISSHELDLPSTYIHGACLVYVDGIGSGLSGSFASQSHSSQTECLNFILSQLEQAKLLSMLSSYTASWVNSQLSSESRHKIELLKQSNKFGVVPFSIFTGSDVSQEDSQFAFTAHTTSINALRVLRALQLSRPILLEGSPGGGKTSLVSAIAKASNHRLIRINLSEQTDASDLFGADLPVENGTGGQFAWRDGPLLAALKAGHWIVLDELNLASQSVLESLNSVFDHRGELYVPELGCCFQVDRSKTRIFACQNPVQEGGGRKALPKSFLNRFTQVHVDNLSSSDLLFILQSQFPNLERPVLKNMVKFNQQVYNEVVQERKWGHVGSPWEFNLRDMTRWCQLMVEVKPHDPSLHMYLVYGERLRTGKDRQKLYNIFYEVFDKEAYSPTRYFHITPKTLQIGNAVIKREGLFYPSSSMNSSIIVPSMLHGAEALIEVLNKKWPCIVTGPAGSGKSRLVETLAGLSGRKLQILATNSSMDAVELLGGFEQSDLIKSILNILRKVHNIIMECCKDILSTASPWEFCSDIQNILMAGEKIRRMSKSLENVEDDETIQNLFLSVESELAFIRKSVSTFMVNVDRCMQLQECTDTLKKIVSHTNSRGAYEWIDSILVQSLQQGDWLLVKGANFCSPSVLDRLNALLEPSGVLTITERGIIDGKVVEIKPHPDFRLILSLDPSCGELSRAMRNRCVEIHLSSDPGLLDQLINTPALKGGNHQNITWQEVNSIIKSKCSNFVEMASCLDFAQKLQKNLKGSSHLNAKLKVLQEVECFIENLRRGTAISKNDTIHNKSQALFQMTSPTLKDLIICPTLSNVMRQFEMVQQIPQICRTRDFNIRSAIQSFFRVFLEFSTKNDHTIRNFVIEEFLPVVMNELTSGFKSLTKGSHAFSSLSHIVFSSKNLEKANCCIPDWQDQPWDPQWNMQLLNQSGYDIDPSVYSKIMLKITYHQLKAEEDFCNISPTSRKRKEILNTGSTFQIASSLQNRLLKVSDLPHPVLLSLVPLYQSWNIYIKQVLLSATFNIPNQDSFCKYEGLLRRISFVWRHFMQSFFSLPKFILLYLYLRKQMLMFKDKLLDHEAVEVWNILENMDKILQINDTLEQEQKIQVKIRSSLSSSACEPFQTEFQFLVQSYCKSLFDDFALFIKQAFHNKKLTHLTWLNILDILKQFLTVQVSSLPLHADSKQHKDSDGEDMDTECTDTPSSHFSLTQEIVDNGIPLSSKSTALMEKLSIIAEPNTIKAASQNCTFGVTHHQQNLWRLLDCFSVAKELSCLTSYTEFTEIASTVDMDKLSSLQCGRDLQYFYEILRTVQSRSLFAWRRYFLTRVWDWSPLKPPIQVDKGNETHIISSSAHSLSSEEGPSNLLRPCITNNVLSLLYDNWTNGCNTTCKTLDKVRNIIYSDVRVPVSEVTTKVHQLESVSQILWSNAFLTCGFSSQSYFYLGPQLIEVIHFMCQSFSSTLHALFNACSKRKIVLPEECASVCDKLLSSTEEFISKTKMDVLKEVSLQLLDNTKLLSDVVDTTTAFQSQWIVNVCQLLSACVDSISRLQQTITNAKESKQWSLQCWKMVGEAWVWCGYLQMILVAPRGPADPVTVQQLKTDCLSEELHQCTCDITVRNLSNQTLTGYEVPVGDITSLSFLHPHIKALGRYVVDLEGKIQRSKSKSAFRLDMSQFHQLSNDCSNFTGTVANLNTLKDVMHDFNNEKYAEELAWSKEKKLQLSFQAFHKSLKDNYPCYPDIVEPLQDAIAQIRFGFRLIRTACSMKAVQDDVSQASDGSYQSCIEDVITDVVIAKHSNNDLPEVIHSLKQVQSAINEKSGQDNSSAILTETILIGALLQLHTKCNSGVTELSKQDTMKIFKEIVQHWHKQQDIKQQKEAEKASLFKYQEKKHEINEEEEAEEEFNEMFPTFGEVVSDLLDPTGLNEIETKSAENLNDNHKLSFSDTVFDLAALVHCELSVAQPEYRTNCQEDNLNTKAPNSKVKENVKRSDPAVAPVDCFYSCIPELFFHRMMSSTLTSMLPWLLGHKVDHALLRSHILASVNINNYLTIDQDISSVNIYVDPTPSEVSRCLPVLQDFHNTVTEKLLVEWPKHPVLNHLIVIIDRILSFSITFPIMKFVTGLELLLEKAQEWESNASKQVSISHHLEAVTTLILDWRRLELKSWNRLLDDAQQNARKDLTNWWFYLYQIVDEYDENSYEGDQISEVKNISTTLQKFIETSKIGQFEARLNLLSVFYSHLCCKHQKQDPLAMVFINLHCYYKQFLDALKVRIASLRQPIEKDLKSFVKIAKWNDINFYAVKDSTIKTHRNLFKFVKKFSTALEEPVHLNVLKGQPSAFASTSDGSQSQGMLLCKKWLDNSGSKLEMMQNMENVTSFHVSGDLSIPQLSRLPAIADKLQKHCSGWVKQMNKSMPQLLLDLEDTTANIIENFKILRGLEPSTATSSDEELRKKRLMEVKHIQSRKRKSLSDLFKLLRDIGLSYRKGLVWLNNHSTDSFVLLPTPSHFGDSSGNIGHGLIQNSLQSGEKYFYRMISRFSSLTAALNSPNKEIGRSHIDRLRGFTAHLFHLATEQRQVMSELTQTNKILDQLNAVLIDFAKEEDTQLPCQTNATSKIHSCRNALNEWLGALEKFQTTLKCCPKNTDTDEYDASKLFPHICPPKISFCRYGDKLWTEVMTSTNKEINLIKAACNNLKKVTDKCFDQFGSIKTGCMILSSIIQVVEACNASMQESSQRISKEIFPLFETSTSWSQNLSPTSPLLIDLVECQNILLSCRESSKNHPDNEAISTDELLCDLEDFLSSVMLRVQNLVKFSSELQSLETETEVNLLEMHFTTYINQRTMNYFENLDVQNFRVKVLNLLELIQKMAGKEEHTELLAKTLKSLRSIIQPFATVVKEVSLASAITHRVTCKLNFVLLSIFSEVAAKGFCPPAEFEEELSEDTGEFKEVEDAGIGEGQGSKDVSDQIEEENQVEDNPDTKNQDDDNDDIPPEDNAIEMSTDFDGKFQDDAPPDDENSEEETEKEDLEKQMGDLGDEDEANKLDERMWGSDEEEEQEDSSDKKEEKGQGVDSEQSELAARDDEVHEGKNEEKKEEEEKFGDQSEFDPNEKDDIHESEPNPPPEPMDLPDDINIDDGNGDEEKEDESPDNDTLQDDKLDENMDITENEDKETEITAEDDKNQDNDAGDEIQDEMDEKNTTEESNEEKKVMEDDQSDDDAAGEDANNEQEDLQNAQTNEEKQEDDEENDVEDDHDDTTRNAGNQIPIEEEQAEDHEVRDKSSRAEKQVTEDDVMQCDDATEEMSQQMDNEGKDDDKGGRAPSKDQSGHESANLTSKSASESHEEQEEKAQIERKSGESDSKRSLADSKPVIPKRLRMMDDVKEVEDDDESKSKSNDADLHQHVSEDVKGYDAEALDAATEEQRKQQLVHDDEEKEKENEELPTNIGDMDNEDDVVMETVEGNENKNEDLTKNPQQLSNDVCTDVIDDITESKEAEQLQENDKDGLMEERDLPLSSLHTNIAQWSMNKEFLALTPDEIVKIRAEMEQHLSSTLQHDEIEISEAETMWHQYQSVTQPLSQELSEQLRLILEPTQAAKLQGDYRSGKRLNMRKVIPYIASGFRKDKIWLRRSKPSKREYQIMLAIDDSSSMSDNHTKQLAFESLAVISTALSTLEAGQLAVCNFGEDAKLLHDFNQPFTDQSGASVLQQCSFKQEQTKIAKLLDASTRFMKAAQVSYSSSTDPRISQLLIIVSDGRGLYVEGRERVERAVRSAIDAGVFLAFVILDNPDMKDSILDIKVPIFKEAGKMPEIRSYLTDFPFPFYVIIRDINALPETLSEALRQWFEMVTSVG